MIKLQHKKIGKYILIPSKKVAELKHSSIFIGIDCIKKNKILIKVISKNQYNQNEFLQNSLDFQLSLRKILTQKQKILTYKDFIVTKTNYYFVMQEPKGQTIKTIIQKKGKINEKDLVKYLRKMKSTFNFLHLNHITHGNINTRSFLVNHGIPTLGYPSNIKASEIVRLKVSQQPILKEISTKHSDYIYFSPELLLQGTISPSNDIWSLGVTIYESLFGSPPWNCSQYSSLTEIAELMINQKLRIPKQDHISKSMKHFISKCLQTDPAQRFGWQDIIEHEIFSKDIQRINNSKQTSI